MVKTPSKNFSRVLQNLGFTPNNKIVQEPNHASLNNQQNIELKQQETTFDAETMAIVNKYLNLAPITTQTNHINSFNNQQNIFNSSNHILKNNSENDLNHEPELIHLNLEQTKQEISNTRPGATNPMGEFLEKQFSIEVNDLKNFFNIF